MLNLIPQPKNIKIMSGVLNYTSDTPITKTIIETLEADEYSLVASEDKIDITSGSETGLFYAEQTLKQLIEFYDNDIPCCEINDKPTFRYRGFMLDCARHSFTVEEIKRVIDEIALLKINYFHWHLTDDQGWRIYIDKYPQLYEIATKRKDSCFNGKSANEPYFACFSKEELKEIVDYCAKRYITIIPEFDIPGHTSAFLSAFPELSCSGKPVEVKTKGGIFSDVLCVSKNKTFEVICDIFDEILEIFPSEYIHIGGDEVPKNSWDNCPNCRKYMIDNRLKSSDDLQAHFTKRVTDYLSAKGRKAIVWNDIIKSNVLTPDNVIVQRWMEKGNRTQEFANDGGIFIESDFFHYYCDYPYGFTPLSKTYNYNPYIDGLNSKDSLYGVEAPLWTEQVNNFNRLCYMLFPRLLAYCETAWNGNDKGSYKVFRQRATVFLKHYDNSKLAYAPYDNWTPRPVRRLKETLDFFKGFLSKETLTEFLKNTFNKGEVR